MCRWNLTELTVAFYNDCGLNLEAIDVPVKQTVNLEANDRHEFASTFIRSLVVL
jgi:hypothetical protein